MSDDKHTETLIEMEANELEYTGDWRAQKAEEYPDDERNAEAAKLLRSLAEQLRVYTGPKVAQYEALIAWNGDDGTLSLSDQWNNYQSRIGFDHFPETADEYFDELFAMARKEAPEAAYLIPEPPPEQLPQELS